MCIVAADEERHIKQEEEGKYADEDAGSTYSADSVTAF